MRIYKVNVRGVSALLQHNSRLANPSDPLARAMKAITSKPAKGKNAKSEADLIELQRLEFMGGLVLGSNGPIIKDTAVEGVIRDGAKAHRKGKATEAGLQAYDAVLEYDGPRDPDALWTDGRFMDYRSVVVGKSRVMRTRPKFEKWSATFEIEVFSDDITEADLREWLKIAGARVGIGDYRPKFGRFEVL